MEAGRSSNLTPGRTSQASENDNLQNALNELEEEYKIQFGIFSQESARQEKYEATIPAEKTLVVLEMIENKLSLLTTEKQLKQKELSCFQEIEYLKKDVAEHVKEQIKLKQNF